MSTGNESTASAMLSTSLDAAADLSSSQFLFGKINSSGKLAVATTRGERVHGVIATDPAAANRSAMLTYGGIMRVTAGGTFNPGVELTTNASAQAIQATEATDVVIGTAKEAGVSGADVSILVGVAGGYLSNPGAIVQEDFTDYAAAGAGKTVLCHDGSHVDPAGTAGTIGVCELVTGQRLGYYAIGTQTATVFVDAAGYVDISGDQTDNDGYEIFSGQWPASGSPFIVGESAAFKLEVLINIADVSGTDMLFCGFRRRENVYQGTMTGYNTYFGLGSTTEANPMAIYVREELNGAAGAETDTGDTKADGIDFAIGVYVSAAGVATVKHGTTIAGLAAPAATSTFTFDTGDSVIPILRFLQANATQTGVVKLLSWDASYQ